MKFLLFLFIGLLLCTSCKEKPSKIYGVWYTVENFSGGAYYFEAHINDTLFTVVNQDGLSYISSYEINDDTLKQYIKDLQNDYKVFDTVNFTIESTLDSFNMKNLYNPKATSSWKKIEKVTPTDFLIIEDENEFSTQFRERFISNYLSKTKNINTKILLQNFDVRWDINDKK